MKELRILLVVRTMACGGGAENLVYNTYKQLKTIHGIIVKLVSFQKSEIFNLKNIDYFEKELQNDPDFIILDDKVEYSIFKKNKISLNNFEKLINSFKPHIIHSHMFLAELYSREILFGNIKYFSHLHDNMVQLRNFSINTLFSKKLFTNYYEKIKLVKKYNSCNNKFIAISQDTLCYLKKTLPSPLKKNVFLLHNAINLSKYQTDLTQVYQKKINNTIKLINIGNFSDNKNQIFLVDIVYKLRLKGFHASLELLGEGKNKKIVEQKIKNLELSEWIFCRGNVNNVADYLQQGDIYLHSAFKEAFGIAIVEAMAAGLPVITLDGGGNRDLIEEGKNGFMIYENNPEIFAEKIIELIQNKELYESMSKYAIEFAKKYDIKEYVDKLLKIYNEA